MNGRGLVGWLVGVVDLVVLVVFLLASPEQSALSAVLSLAGVASFVGIGALLMWRVPKNPVGPLLSTIGTLVVVTGTLNMYASLGSQQSPAWPAVEAARTVGEAIFIVPIALAVVAVPLVFPDGRLPSPRYRLFVVMLILGLTAWMIGALLLPLDGIVLIALPTAFAGGVAAIVQRFRRGDPVKRAQVKWLAAIVVVAALAVMSGLLASGVFPDLGNALVIVGVLALAAMPLAIGVAMLRYRLYEIDRIISRTVGYVIVTGILAAVFVATIVAVQAALTPVTSGQTIPVAASTLLVFALFQPIRWRVQHVVDRRFDRARYDADLTAQAFAARLRDQTDLGAVMFDLRRTTQTAVAPTVLGVWIRGSDS